MSLTAQYVDGQLVTQKNQTQTTSQATNATTNEVTKGGNSLDKEAFLQLLVAQMKYQDPLEPTSNTEYISQYATFSELEQMQNVSANSTLQRATELVGKEVIMESQDSKGDTKQIQGYVEKVVYNGSKAYLVVDGSQYSIDDLKTVIDEDYKAGTDTVAEIQKILDKLPKVENLTLADAQNVTAAYSYYKTLTTYQLTLLPADTEKTLDAYVGKMNDIVAEALEKAEEEAAEDTKESEADDTKITEDELDALLKDLDADTEEV